MYATLLHDPSRQLLFYHPGIGTMEHPAALTDVSRKVTRLLGKAVGFGLENDMRDAYIFIMRNFTKGDSLFLFGFSRGAYTVRAVASLLHMYGLIRPGHESLVPYAIRTLMAVNSKKRDRNKRAAAAFALAQEFKATFCSVDCKPHFVGVWDTVSSVGWVENPLKLPFLGRNPDIEIARHAVAMDERRAFFRTNLWRPGNVPQTVGPKDLKEVWVPGVHCDVGGGYKETESALSKFPLEWMLAEGHAAGLLLDDRKKEEVLGRGSNANIVRADANGTMHDSLTKGWYVGEFIPKRHYDFKTKKTRRRMNFFRRRKMGPAPMVHEAAYERSNYTCKIPKDAQKVRTVWANQVQA